MSEFGEEYTLVPLQCDSTSAISVAKNPVLHSKTKHIEVRYHFLRGNFHSFARGPWCLFDFLSWVCGSSFVAYV
jgi:hypothetical protein